MLEPSPTRLGQELDRNRRYPRPLSLM